METGRIYKMPAQGGQAVLVNSNLSGWDPTESEDGRFFYFIGEGTDLYNLGLWRIPIEGGDSKQLLNSINSWGPAYVIEDDGIYFIPNPDPAGNYSIQFLDLSTGKIKTLAGLGKQSCGNLSVSPDRRWALYAQQDQAGSDLMLVENFR
jgi:Tol biopolymer transport system component